VAQVGSQAIDDRCHDATPVTNNGEQSHQHSHHLRSLELANITPASQMMQRKPPRQFALNNPNALVPLDSHPSTASTAQI
jgi:hypothetical protein